jgi:energy-coupling factor transport system ATP-binding protein
MDAEAAVRVAEFSCRYGAGQPLRLERVSLQVAEGELVAVLGPSGGGKSTLALAVNGIVPHELEGSETAGDVWVRGLRVAEHRVDELVREVGTVLQDPDWQLVSGTVADELALTLENLGVPPPEIGGRVRAAAWRLGIEHLLARSPDELSGGEQQRVAIAACLAVEPPVLVLDEPLSELDQEGKRAVLEAVAGLHQDRGTTVLFIDHNVDLVAPLADRVVLLSSGRVVADGPPRTVLADPRPRERAGVPAPQVMEIAAALPERIRPPAPPLTVGELPTAGEPRPAVPDSPDARVSAAPAIAVHGAWFGYGPDDVLRDVTLAVHPGEYVALVGSNGAGKSTLARLLAGLLRPRLGAVELGGRPLSGLPRREIARRAGCVFQNPDVQFFTSTCQEEVAFGLRLHGLESAEIEARVSDTLDELGLAEFAREHPHFLSRGQRRRLALATALALRPAVLVLDEPTTGLDGGTAGRLLDLVDRLRARGHAIVVLTHEMRVVLERAERVVVLHAGRIVADGDPRRLLTDADLVGRCGIAPPVAAQVAPGSRTSAEAAARLAGRVEGART